MNPIKKLVAAISAAFSIFSAYATATVYYVTPDGTGGGTSWSDATTLADANGKVEAGDTIRMKAGPYAMKARVQVSKAITIEGGYAGTDDTNPEMLAGNPLTILDGNHDSEVKEGIYLTSSSGTNYFRRVQFSRFGRRGFLKVGTSSLAMYDCKFVNNSSINNLQGRDGGQTFDEDKFGGRGGLFIGTSSTGIKNNNPSSSTLILSNCVFEGNVHTREYTEQWNSLKGKYEAANFYAYYGGGAYFLLWKEVLLDDCKFITNGVPASLTYTNPRQAKGAAVYGYKAPIIANRCDFRGNAMASAYGYFGTAIELSSGCGGSAFTNCLWVGNRVNRGAAATTSDAGMTAFYFNAGASAKLDIVNCTFAYNIMGGETKSAAGLTIGSGVVNVQNSIFYGNRTYSNKFNSTDPSVSTYVNSDIYASGASATINLVDSFTENAVTGAKVSGDPLFVTPLEQFTSCIKSTAKASVAFKEECMEQVLNFDVHLLSTYGYYNNAGEKFSAGTTNVTSAAIDSGSSDSSFDLELSPNGGIVNMGRYGNTVEAAHSPSGQPVLSDNDVNVTYNTYGQPTVTVTPRLDDGGVEYNAKVNIVIEGDTAAAGIIAAGNKSYDFDVAGIKPNQEVTYSVNEIFAPNSVLNVQVVVTSDGAEPVSVIKSVQLSDAVLPDCYGHGKTGVVHCWADAPGNNDGSSWVHAYRNLADAVNDLNEGATELWIAGTNVLSQSVARYSATIAEGQILGGFTGMENDASSRAPEAISVIDGNNLYIPLSLANVNRVYIERIKFVRGSPHNIYKVSSVGDLEFRDCQFLDCAKSKANFVGDPEVNLGLGGYFVGNGTSELIFSNCVFRGNRVFKSDEKKIRGAGAYFKNYAQVVMNDCIFAHNGVSFTSNGSGLTFQYDKDGGAFSADNSKIVASRCQFLANSLLSNESAGNGIYCPSGIVMLNGSACGGSVFTNCLWAGNQISKCNTASYGIPNNAGMLSITTSAAADPVDVVNCTYYCNLVDAQNSPVSINVFAGKLNAVNSIFYGAVTGVYQNVAKQIYVHSGASADISNCLIEENEDVGCENGGTLVMNDCLFNQDPNFVGIELWNCLNRRISVSNYSNQDTRKKKYINHDNFAIYDMTNLNVHVKSSAGYYDENTGELVTFRRESSPAVDAGKKLGEIKEREPHGNKVNLGFYGNTPWATLSAMRGLSVIVR